MQFHDFFYLLDFTSYLPVLFKIFWPAVHFWVGFRVPKNPNFQIPDTSQLQTPKQRGWSTFA